MKDNTVKIIESCLPTGKKQLAKTLYEAYGLEATFTQNPDSLYEEISAKYGNQVADGFIHATCLND